MNGQEIPCACYYRAVIGKRVLVIGLEPPPFGGISVHVQRVTLWLAQNNLVNSIDVIKEYNKRSKIGYWCFILKKLVSFRPQEIHYHVLFLRSGLSEFFLLVLFAVCFRARVRVIEHSSRFLYRRSWRYKFWFNRLMYFVDQQILIGQPMVQAYQDNGIILRAYTVESAFIEPTVQQGSAIFARYPQTLHDFLAHHDYVILMNASKFGLWQDQDVYGFDFCVRLMHDLAAKNIGLILAVGTVYDHVYYELILHQFQGDPRVYFLLEQQEELWPLIQKINLFIRPSRFDNASVSVAEALWCGVPTIASDVTPRPDGCILFKTGDYDDFLVKVYGQVTGKYYHSHEKSLN